MQLVQRTNSPSVMAVCAACVAVLSSIASARVAGQEPGQQRSGPPTLLSEPLADVPGKNLVVVELNFAPNPGTPSTADDHPTGHRHPGSVYVYVTQGAVRLALEGEPVRIVRAGESFFEPPHAHHIITENASATEPASAIAVMIVPEGEPILTLDGSE